MKRHAGNARIRKLIEGKYSKENNKGVPNFLCYTIEASNLAGVH